MNEFEWMMLGIMLVGIGLITWIVIVAIDGFFKINDYGKERETQKGEEAEET